MAEVLTPELMCRTIFESKILLTARRHPEVYKVLEGTMDDNYPFPWGSSRQIAAEAGLPFLGLDSTYQMVGNFWLRVGSEVHGIKLGEITDNDNYQPHHTTLHRRAFLRESIYANGRKNG